MPRSWAGANAAWLAALAVAIVAASTVAAMVVLAPAPAGQQGLPPEPPEPAAALQPGEPPQPAAPLGLTVAPSVATAQGEQPAAEGVRPTRLRIPSIDVSTELIALGVDSTGVLEVPADPNVAGWFKVGPVPGDAGPALLAGHVDSKKGPAVFFRLKTLQPRAEVHVDRSDGRTVTFLVHSVRTYPKDQFPTAAVYAPTPVPELRLVTCGGPFDRLGGRYLDNVIVDAVLP
jgi:sortase (surface protein transpeptidase)